MIWGGIDVKIETKCTINVICLNHPETTFSTLVCRKAALHKICPWCQKGWKALPWTIYLLPLKFTCICSQFLIYFIIKDLDLIKILLWLAVNIKALSVKWASTSKLRILSYHKVGWYLWRYPTTGGRVHVCKAKGGPISSLRTHLHPEWARSWGGLYCLSVLVRLSLPDSLDPITMDSSGPEQPSELCH